MTYKKSIETKLKINKNIGEKKMIEGRSNWFRKKI